MEPTRVGSDNRIVCILLLGGVIATDMYDVMLR